MKQQLIIQNASLIDGTGAPPRAGTVWIEDDTIVAVGADADAKARDNPKAKRVDAKGLTVMPGLIDAHCHTTFDETAGHDEVFYHRRPGLSAVIAGRHLRRILTAGVTGILDPDSIFDLGVDMKDAIDCGVIEGPRMVCGGYALMTSVGGAAGRLMPDEGTLAYARIVRTKDEIAAEVRRQIKIGCDWIKVHVTGSFSHRRSEGEMLTWTPEELKLVVDLAHDLGIPVMGHCRDSRSIVESCKAGFDQIIHATNMDDRAIEALVKRGAHIVPAFTFQANLAEFGDSIHASPAMQDLFRREIEESAAALVKAFRAGVPMLTGSEAGFSVTPYGDWHHRELEVFVNYLGLTPLEAIKCATESGGLALAKKAKVGTIAPGRKADLIGVAGDPSKDVGILGDRDKIKFVMLGGKQIDLTRTEPERKPIPGWRTADFGEILTQDIVRKTRDRGLRKTA
jgi:imidazolonepropionase-like amidohydrolase